ncbi:MAG: hypothetical protein L0216_19065 [Planctomycetales bacterium]|nr:hypothetical protein [Planctomycetales bacterium]
MSTAEAICSRVGRAIVATVTIACLPPAARCAEANDADRPASRGRATEGPDGLADWEPLLYGGGCNGLRMGRGFIETHDRSLIRSTSGFAYGGGLRTAHPLWSDLQDHWDLGISGLILSGSARGEKSDGHDCDHLLNMTQCVGSRQETRKLDFQSSESALFLEAWGRLSGWRRRFFVELTLGAGGIAVDYRFETRSDPAGLRYSGSGSDVLPVVRAAATFGFELVGEGAGPAKPPWRVGLRFQFWTVYPLDKSRGEFAGEPGTVVYDPWGAGLTVGLAIRI